MTPAAQPTILVVDDEKSLLSLLTLVFEAEGYRVVCAPSGPEGLRLFSEQAVDIVILDYLMPQMNGGEVAREMRRMKPDVPIIMLSACLTVPDDARDLVNEFVEKGEGTDALLRAVQRILGPAPGASPHEP